MCFSFNYNAGLGAHLSGAEGGEESECCILWAHIYHHPFLMLDLSQKAEK